MHNMSDAFDAKKIKGVIKEKRIKVKDLALAIGVTPNTLSSALNGNRALGKSALISLFRELNLNAEALKRKAA